MTRPTRKRTVLSKQQATEIFKLKNNLGFASCHSASAALAVTYKVSSKAIRDIWSGRSWLDATYHLWDSSNRPPRKVVGRPKGRKDTKPRQPRSSKAAQTSALLDGNPAFKLEALPANTRGDFPASVAVCQSRSANSIVHETYDGNALVSEESHHSIRHAPRREPSRSPRHERAGIIPSRFRCLWTHGQVPFWALMKGSCEFC